MKLIYFSLLLLSVIFVSFTVGDKKFPNADLKSLEGETIHLNGTFKYHKLTVISFWATWCSPCKKELDAIKELYPEWQKLGIELVAVTIDDAQALNKVKPMVAQKGWGYTILSDQNKDMLRRKGFPT